ncbi:MAG: hypothetical protein U0992_18435 [Planctomycetaceae bacterium]
MLRHVLLTTAVLGCFVSLVSVQAADQSSASPGGTWGWSYDYGQGEVKSLLTLQVKDKLVTGMFYGQNDKVEIKDGTFDGTKVEFKFDIVHDGQTITVSFNGVPSEDAIKGTLSAKVDGQAHEFPWKAARATRPEDVVGVWKLKIETDNGQTFEPEVKLEQAESKLTGRYVSKEVGEHDLKDVTLEDNVLKFSVSISKDGHTLKLDYQGKPRGDQLAGEIQYDLDGNTGSTKYTGALSPPKAE